MHIFKFLSLMIISCTILNEANSIDNNKIDNIIIEYSPNYFHYIYCNGKRVFIEDMEDEVSNNKLLKFTNGCIEVNSVYETNNRITFNEVRTKKFCNMLLKNNSDIDSYNYTFNFSNGEIIPNLETCNNTTVRTNHDNSNTSIYNKVKVNQCGKFFKKIQNNKIL